jgi:hypothetical protein
MCVGRVGCTKPKLVITFLKRVAGRWEDHHTKIQLDTYQPARRIDPGRLPRQVRFGCIEVNFLFRVYAAASGHGKVPVEVAINHIYARRFRSHRLYRRFQVPDTAVSVEGTGKHAIRGSAVERGHAGPRASCISAFLHCWMTYPSYSPSHLPCQSEDPSPENIKWFSSICPTYFEPPADGRIIAFGMWMLGFGKKHKACIHIKTDRLHVQAPKH